MIDRTELSKTPLFAWFVAFGLLDIATALFLAYVLHIQSSILLLLLPPLALWGDNPSTPEGFGAILVSLWLIGGSFLLWGFVGFLVGLIVRLAARRPAAP